MNRFQHRPHPASTGPHKVTNALDRRTMLAAAGALTYAFVAPANSADANDTCVTKAEDQGGTGHAIKAIFFDLGSTLVNSSERSWLPGMREGLYELRSRNIPLGIISNTGDYSRKEVADKFLPPDFDFSVFTPSLVILSCEVDTEKPYRRIWLLAAHRAGEPAHNCLFVGENLSETWHAQQADMQAIRLGDPSLNNKSCPDDTEAEKPGCPGDPGTDIKTLIELLDGKA